MGGGAALRGALRGAFRGVLRGAVRSVLRGVSLRVVRGRAAWLRSVVRAAEGGARRRACSTVSSLGSSEEV